MSLCQLSQLSFDQIPSLDSMKNPRKINSLHVVMIEC